VIRVVFDTNVLVSAIVFGGPPQALLVAAAGGAFPLYSSGPLKSELFEVLERFKLTAEELRDLEHRLAFWQVVQPAEEISACSDSDDNRVLECAVECGASHIVTGDGALLALDPFRGIRIVRAASFLAERPWETASEL
jgi:putative PIN family toxin of toxin-antitoxin system